MKKLLGKSLKLYLKTRFGMIQSWIQSPHEAQATIFNSIIHQGKDTSFGKAHDFDRISTYTSYQKHVPIRDYEALHPYIHRMLLGEKNVLWPGLINYFAKSSGTSGSQSKYLPVSKRFLKDSLTRGSWDTMALIYHNFDDANILEYKSLIIGGSLEPYVDHPNSIVGDVSAIMLTNMPLVSRPFYTPDIETATMSEWETKLEKIADITSKQSDIGMISGVPTWNIVLFKKILELTGKRVMSDVWPHFQAYIHGGIKFGPYRSQFERFFPDRSLTFQEVYNASEGYFATQYSPHSCELLLLLDNGVFYEFMPIEELKSKDRQTISLADVVIGQVYSMIISTNAGLYRYELGDTIRFTSTQPYLIEVVGRTKSFINAFGEELMIHNAESALEMTCAGTDIEIANYTVAPKYLSKHEGGRHDWLIEFEVTPANLPLFAKHLDQNIQSLNSDYAAKRVGDLVLHNLHIFDLPKGTFETWLKGNKRVSAQSKIPRLANDRRYVDDILNFVELSTESKRQ